MSRFDDVANVIGFAALGAAVGLKIFGVFFGGWWVADNFHQQTVLLTRIAVATEATQAQTRQPVDIRLAGFTPEAQDTLSNALKQKGK